MLTLDWAQDASVNGVITTNWEKTDDEPGALDGVTINGRRSGLVYSGELSLGDMRQNVEAVGFAPEIAPEVTLSIAVRVVQSMNGKELASMGVQIADTTTFPAGQVLLDTAVLNYGNNTPPNFPQVAVTLNSTSHMAYAYIDSDFDGDYDRVIQLGFIG